jgi:hypothetical protein
MTEIADFPPIRMLCSGYPIRGKPGSGLYAFAVRLLSRTPALDTWNPTAVLRLGLYSFSRISMSRSVLLTIALVVLMAPVAVQGAAQTPGSSSGTREVSSPSGVGALDSHFAASPVPDRIVLTWSADPATSISVTWRTDASVHQAALEIARADASPHFVGDARRVRASSQPLTAENGLAHHHSAQIYDLEPGVLYAYRVGGGEVWSEWFHYRTASPDHEPFSFLYFGDAQNDIRSLWSRAIRGAYAEAPSARFMIHAGDLVNLRAGSHDNEWGAWFGAGGWLNAMMPSIPAVGNHEYVKSDTADIYSGLSPHWNRQFTLPRNGPAGLEGTVYHLDYQGLRVIVLNSLHALEFGSAAEQARWMEPLLRENPNRWTVVVYHHPMYSMRDGRDNPPLRNHWKPLFDRYGVDLVLQGHDHAYGRGRNVAEGTMAHDAASGTVYVVSVSGPKMYELGEQSDWMSRRAENTQLYQIVHVDGERLRFEARTVVGEIYDAFDLVKQANGRSQLIDHAPQTPERHGVPARLPVGGG